MQVVECVNADALVVKTADGVQKKIHFSSLRPPRYCLTIWIRLQIFWCMFSEAPDRERGGGGGWGVEWALVTAQKLGGACGPLPKILTLFMTKMAKSIPN